VTSREFNERFSRRSRRAGTFVPPEVVVRLEAYFRLLAVWNRKINVTGFDLADPAPEAIDRLLIEPLVAAKYVPRSAKRVLDIGSGSGSPALPLAVSHPGIQMLLVESKTRKAAFLAEAIRILDLPKVGVATSRFEELLTRPDLHEGHDLLTVRAVRMEARTLMSLQAFVRAGGLLFLFRGATGKESAEFVHPPLSWKATYPLLESLRSRLVVLEKHGVGRST